MASVVEMGSGDDGSLFVQTQPVIPGAWVLSNQIVTPAGRPASTEPGHRGLRGTIGVSSGVPRLHQGACTSGKR